jgi:hypothetical protein
MRTIRRGLHPTLPRYRLGHTYKPHLSFAPASDTGSFEADQKAASLCLLRPPPPPEEQALLCELKELEALEQEAEAAEAARLLAAAADEIWEGETWLSHDLDSPDL